MGPKRLSNQPGPTRKRPHRSHDEEISSDEEVLDGKANTSAAHHNDESEDDFFESADDKRARLSKKYLQELGLGDEDDAQKPSVSTVSSSLYFDSICMISQDNKRRQIRKVAEHVSTLHKVRSAQHAIIRLNVVHQLS